MQFSKKYLAMIGGVVLIVLVTGVTAGAPEKAVQHPADKRKRPALARILGEGKSKETLETIRMVRTIEALKLNEEQIAQFLPRQRRMREAKKEFRQSRKERLEELEGLLKSKASSRDLERALENLKEQEKVFRETTERLKEEIEGFLTSEQRVQLILFERSFRKEMREMLKRHPKGKRLLEKRRGLGRPERKFPEEELPLKEGR